MNAPGKISVLPHFLIGERKTQFVMIDYCNNRSEIHIFICFSLAKIVLVGESIIDNMF